MTVPRILARLSAVAALASVVVFGATALLPSDAVDARTGGRATAAEQDRLRAELGLDRPVWRRYADWVTGLARGDAGRSLLTGRPVGDVVAERLPATLTLAGAAMALTVPLTVALAWLLGATAGRRSRAARPVGGLVTVAAALPQVVLAALLVTVFAGLLRALPPVSLLPAGGSPLDDPALLVLPALTLAIPSAAYGATMLGGAVADTLRRPHVAAAVARGVPARQVAARHVLPFLLAPALRIFALLAGGTLAATAVVETFFGYAGLGELLAGAVASRDVPVVQAIALAATGVVLAGFLAADLAAALTDEERPC
ncbi:ABC transporter permease [Actinomadura flavalba]|uniref:ABC transporter permease n=1 Tax=Actinomadura flavalba TaxID=1120938 RepID=UPI00037F522B|nr:ABC transporter permease [Actinomadura flavalba]